MARVLEAIFRRPMLLLIMIVVFPVVSLAVAYFLPRSYQTTASIWALRRYEIIGATGSETNLLATPAETQATALSELLQSRTFALLVADEANLASTLSPAVQADHLVRDDTMYADISKNVKVTPEGYNLYVVTYANQNPWITQKVIAAVIHNFTLQSLGFSAVEGQRLLASYEVQLAHAKHTADAAVKAESQYITSHPQLTHNDLLTDPQYAQLHAQSQQAQTTLQGVQTQIATINDEITALGGTSDSFFKVLDAPIVPDRAVSRTKLFLMAGGIGAGLAVVSCILFIAILVRRDHTIHTKADLQKVTTYPVLMQLPYLARAHELLVIDTPVNNSSNNGTS